MDEKKYSETANSVYDSLTDEQKAKTSECETQEELSDEAAEDAAGGVQAGDIFKRTRTEFGGTPRREETDAERARRMLIAVEGKPYL